MKIAVLIEERCKPKSEAFAYLSRYAGTCGSECIQVIDDKCKILENACPPCLVRAKLCPGDAVKIINLPEELSTDMIHRYSLNGFRLFRLPTPSKDSVVGILGPNGMGKSTAINILSGTIIPNLGNWEIDEGVWEDVIKTLPRGELRDFLTLISDEGVEISVKPQYIDKLPKVIQGKVGDLLKGVDERNLLNEISDRLEISHLLERNLPQLSGGELQRVAICATVLKDADVYFFDEPSSYLDIHERMRIVKLIQELAETKRVLVIEHDLAILDVLCDLVHIVYGDKGAFGIFTPPRTTRTAINAYLDGYLPEQNVRIRNKPIKFQTHTERNTERGIAFLEWGGLEKKLGDFSLKTGEGKIHRSEVVGVVGANGIGKSTLVKILAGEHEADEGWITVEAKISYKKQHVEADYEGTVREWLDIELGTRWQQGDFNVNVVKALGVDKLLEQVTTTLSGGELQAVSIVLCLGRDADLYLLDEPSAHLDANARMEAAKAIRRTIQSNEKSAFIIDHDVYFIDIVSDSLLVFEGKGGVEGFAKGPYNLRNGMNKFLSTVDITFRRDHDTKRPRINKLGSRKDREQRAKGEYFYTE